MEKKETLMPNRRSRNGDFQIIKYHLIIWSAHFIFSDFTSYFEVLLQILWIMKKWK